MYFDGLHSKHRSSVPVGAILMSVYFIIECFTYTTLLALVWKSRFDEEAFVRLCETQVVQRRWSEIEARLDAVGVGVGPDIDSFANTADGELSCCRADSSSSRESSLSSCLSDDSSVDTDEQSPTHRHSNVHRRYSLTGTYDDEADDEQTEPNLYNDDDLALVCVQQLGERLDDEQFRSRFSALLSTRFHMTAFALAESLLYLHNLIVSDKVSVLCSFVDKLFF